MIGKIALLCGDVPVCDHCAQDDAKVVVNLPVYGDRVLCEVCVVQLLEYGFDSLANGSDVEEEPVQLRSPHWDSQG